MKDWFDGLESREKLTLVAGGVVLLLALVWVLLINPLYSGAGERAAQIAALREDVTRARELQAEINGLRARGATGTAATGGGNQSLLLILENSASTAGLQVNQSRPIDASTVRVRLESEPFDALVRWMGLLDRQYGVEIDIASLDRLETEGMVDAQLTLKRPG